MASAATATWSISGEYFENCNCDVVCPCLFADVAPLTAKPSLGACEVALAFHIDKGSYGDVSLDGLNAVVVARSPGAMAEGNWSLGAYLDEKADARQHEALQAIFTGAAGGPMAGLAPLVTEVLGVKTAPITFTMNGLQRSVEIPDVAHLSVHPIPSMVPDEPIWALNFSPFAPKGTLAAGGADSTFTDFGMRWDNSGKNGHTAPISWTNG